MPQFRISKNSRSSTSRRQVVISRIETFGRKRVDMGRCTPCLNTNSICFMLDGYKKCSSCTKKGVRECDGVFSAEEFDALTAQRNRLMEATHRKDDEIKRMLEEATRAQLALSQAHAERKRL